MGNEEVMCGHCGWRGKKSQLINIMVVDEWIKGWSEYKACPECNEEIKHVLPPMRK